MSVFVSSEFRPNAQETSGVSHSINRRFIALFRGWDLYERAHGGLSIVDFDLSPAEAPTAFESREEVLAALLDMEECLRGSAGYAPFLHSRIGGSIAYVRALLDQPIPFEEYIQATLGVAATYIPDAEVDAARDEADRWLEHFHLRYRREDRDRFEREFLIHDKSAIMSGIVDNKDVWLSRLGSLSIPVPPELNLKVSFTSVDAQWANWITGTRNGFELAINLHPRKKYQRGSPLSLCLHEICGHAVQMAIWKERIESGEIDQACGVTTVHSPETFSAEGLGQTVHLLFARKFPLPPELWLRTAQQYYELLVMQNAHVMIYQGERIEQVLNYADERLPLSHRGNIETDLRDRTSDPLARTYQLSYSIAERTIRRLIAPMNDAQISEFFSGIYQVPMTPVQLIAFGEQILNNI
jgi:hypothetical protein